MGAQRAASRGSTVAGSSASTPCPTASVYSVGLPPSPARSNVCAGRQCPRGELQRTRSSVKSFGIENKRKSDSIYLEGSLRPGQDRSTSAPSTLIETCVRTSARTGVPPAIRWPADAAAGRPAAASTAGFIQRLVIARRARQKVTGEGERAWPTRSVPNRPAVRPFRAVSPGANKTRETRRLRGRAKLRTLPLSLSGGQVVC